MKNITLITSFVILLACTSKTPIQESVEVQIPIEEPKPQIEIIQNESNQMVKLSDYGLSFEVPSNFIVKENDSEAVVTVHEQNDETQFATFELKVYEEPNTFSSFEAFAADTESNLITEHIKSNNSSKEWSDAELQSELQRLDGHYSFERKEIEGIQVLLHKRDFSGMIGNIYQMSVYSNGKILDFYSESDHEILDQIYFSLKTL